MATASKNKAVKLNFAQWLRLKRDILGFTQAELGKKIGVKPSTISSWEKRINKPGLDPYQMQCFCETLEVDLPELSKAFKGEYEVNG